MKKRIILSGGGTGGHIYPAVAVAESLVRRYGDDVEILFVGADGKMEMEKVPALGYDIIGVPVAGLQRSMSAKNIVGNLSVPFRLAASLSKAHKIIRGFKADIVVGFGGYASAPVLMAAQLMGVPTIIQEQNSYAGLTNKMLGRKANRICTAYDKMERFFPADRIVLTGNPLRGNFAQKADRNEALKYFGLTAEKPVILVVGGSQGTRTLNNMMKRNVDAITASGDVQVIWQTGKYYLDEMSKFMEQRSKQGVWFGAFIDRMDYAYAAADLVISRSGACTVSELCLVGKPTLFVPSPNVAEDHQTKNAKALVDKNAAIMVADGEAVEHAVIKGLEVIGNAELMAELSKNISALAIADSADRVVKEIEKYL